MTFTVTLGWWLIPLALTIATAVYAVWPGPQNYYGFDVAGVLRLLIAVIVALLSWLVWALVRP